MSIIILVPFDLVTIDTEKNNLCMEKVQILQSEKKALMCNNIQENLIEISKFYLNSTSKLREASSLFLSCFFTRPDIIKN